MNTETRQEQSQYAELAAWAIVPFAFSKHTMKREEYVSMVTKEINKVVAYETDTLKSRVEELEQALLRIKQGTTDGIELIVEPLNYREVNAIAKNALNK